MESLLIEKIKAGELSVLGKIYIEHRSKFILQIKHQYSTVEGIHEIAKDIYQETIESLYNNIQSGRLTSLTSVDAYISKIGRNKISELLKKKMKDTRGINWEKLAGTPDDSFQAEEKELLLKTVRNALGNLSDSNRKILDYFYYQDKSIDEIASLMNLNYDSIKSMKSRALKLLLKAFEAIKSKNLN